MTGNSTETYITDPSVARGSSGITLAIFKYVQLLRKEEHDTPSTKKKPNIFLPRVEQTLINALKLNIEAG